MMRRGVRREDLRERRGLFEIRLMMRWRRKSHVKGRWSMDCTGGTCTGAGVMELVRVNLRENLVWGDLVWRVLIFVVRMIGWVWARVMSCMVGDGYRHQVLPPIAMLSSLIPLRHLVLQLYGVTTRAAIVLCFSTMELLFDSSNLWDILWGEALSPLPVGQGQHFTSHVHLIAHEWEQEATIAMKTILELSQGDLSVEIVVEDSEDVMDIPLVAPSGCCDSKELLDLLFNCQESWGRARGVGNTVLFVKVNRADLVSRRSMAMVMARGRRRRRRRDTVGEAVSLTTVMIVENHLIQIFTEILFC
jgi:hypothetical protein